jgi:aspartate carbamoyltransferase catalytic subunit
MSNFIDIEQFSLAQLMEFVELAEYFRTIETRGIKYFKPIEKTVALIFLENSTRTRISFEIAAKRLGLNIIGFDSEKSSLEKGESIKDTVLTLKALGLDAIILRSSSVSTVNQVSSWVDLPIVNAGNATRSHPTQALGDFLTIREAISQGRFTSVGVETVDQVSKLKIAVVGDIIHSRVARSLGELFEILGCQMYLVGPTELLPVYDIGFKVSGISNDINDFVGEVDLIVALRIQLERIHEPLLVDPISYRSVYGITRKLLDKAKDSTLVMHPGPQVRDLEIDSEVIDSNRSLILNQVRNSVYCRMSVLYKTMDLDFLLGDGVYGQ